MLRSDVAEILGKSEVRAMTGHLYRKATGNSLCGPASCVGWSLRVSPGQDSVTRLMETQIWHLPAGCVEEVSAP